MSNFTSGKIVVVFSLLYLYYSEKETTSIFNYILLSTFMIWVQCSLPLNILVELQQLYDFFPFKTN